MEAIIKIQNEVYEKATPPSDEKVKISEDEQKVVLYVAGYVIYTLLKRYKRLKNSPDVLTRETAAAAIDFLKTLDTRFERDIEARSFLEYSNEWIQLKNRGGLVKVDANMFIFIPRVENV
eukprot:TCONS_00036897-protein